MICPRKDLKQELFTFWDIFWEGGRSARFLMGLFLLAGTYRRKK